MKTLDNYKFKNAVGVSCQTLLAICNKTFPLSYGNCFSVSAEESKDLYKSYKIVNFYLENLQHLLEQKIISWPVKILSISETIAVIVDERIPEEYYSETYCDICCPFDLLPHNQQMEYVRKLLRGDIEEIECSNELIAVKYNNKPIEQEVVTLSYKSELQSDSGVVWCDYIPKIFSLK